MGYSSILSALVGGAMLGAAMAYAATRRFLQPAVQKEAMDAAYFDKLVTENTLDGLVVQQVNGVILWCNQAYCDMHMRRREEMIGKHPFTFALPPQLQVSDDVIANYRHDPDDPRLGTFIEKLNCRSNGELFWVQISVQIKTGPSGESLAILVCREVTEQVARAKELAETRMQLEHAAAHDSLTGILNRAAILDRTAQALESAQETDRTISALSIDLDRFKQINDTFGHAAGDAVLVGVAGILSAEITTGYVGRMGGDEYVAVMTDVRDLEELADIGQRLCRKLSEPFDWRGRSLTCGASIGGVRAKPGLTDPDELFGLSDFALYQAKKQGPGRFAVYDEALHQRRAMRDRQFSELSTAIDQNALSFVFQPAIYLEECRVSGFEALVRWDHPTKGRMAPDQFLDMAAELGRMADIDLAAMRAAIAMKLRLRDAGLPEIRLGLNASADALRHPGYVSQLSEALTRYDISPKHVVVEVLENVVLDDPASTEVETVKRLSALGIQTMLDDFGVGHAGLVHLAQLPLDGVKLDKRLIGGMLQERSSEKIVSTVIDLCRDLGMRVVGEGVENVEVAARLRDVGCPILQGYWLSKPLSADQVVPWALAHDSKSTRETLMKVSRAAGSRP